MQAAGLGMALEIRDESGAVMTTGPGELVCSHPFPSMPTHFWNDPGGIRIGTAEIYRQVEQLDEVVESIAVAQETGEGPGDVRIVLFVRLREPLVLSDALRQRIRQRVREHASPHHVPSLIVQVPDIPRTISGKISEIAVRDVIHGRNPTNVDALANPESLAFFRDHPELGQ
jgi:acetoacetyl-CoA synthetase